MKRAKLPFALALLGFTLALAPAPAAVPKTCSSFCATVRCIGGYVCGLYTNSSGQTVCGCHQP